MCWSGLPLAVTTDFPAWQTVYTSDQLAQGRHLISIHDRLREWTRIEQDRHPSPSESIIDSQSVKSAAGVSQQVGFDSGKLIKGRKILERVDTLGLVLRVFVTAASVPEREGGKRVLRRVKRMDKSLCRLTTIWVDGGWHPSDVGDGRLPLDCPGGAAPRQTKGFVLLKKRWWSSAPSVG